MILAPFIFIFGLIAKFLADIFSTVTTIATDIIIGWLAIVIVWLTDIASYLLSLASDIISFLISNLTIITTNILNILIGLVSTIATLIANFIFFVWEGFFNTLGLTPPDLIAIFYYLFSSVIYLVIQIPQGLSDILTFIVAIATPFTLTIWIICIGWSLAVSREISDYMVNIFFNPIFSIDITMGISILGFKGKVPFGLIITAYTILFMIIPNYLWLFI